MEKTAGVCAGQAHKTLRFLYVDGEGIVMTHLFSADGRDEIQNAMTEHELDLLIIGGGITGAGILLDATVRGMHAGLIEMQDFAAGTSSRSTKLIHGGLRYLKRGDIGLVAEVGKERAIVHQNGPHITEPIWMLLPITENGTYGKMMTSIGLYLYDRLAGVKHSERRRLLSIEETLSKEPLLNTEGLKGAGYYVEYRSDDARLTLEILKEAFCRGALALNYTKATRFRYRGGQIIGVDAQDVLNGNHYPLAAKIVVNATGPWGDFLREWDHSKSGKTLHLTKGVHIVVNGNRFPLHQAVYFEVPGDRMIFAIPREGKTYIGTTDTNYTQDPLDPLVSATDQEYLIRCVNLMFPSLKLVTADIESSWAGVRPLIHEEGKNPSEISRKDEIFRSSTGLLTIAGGKLTGYRKMADKVVSMVAQELSSRSGKSYPPCHTQFIAYSGGKFGGPENMSHFMEEKMRFGMDLGLSEFEAKRLVRRYGTNIDQVYTLIQEGLDEAHDHGLSLELYGALRYGIDQEMVMNPEDFFVRRTGALYFDIGWVRYWQQRAIQYMQKRLGWTHDETSEYEEKMEILLHRTVAQADVTLDANTLTK